MKALVRLGIGILALNLLVALPALSQPQRMGGGGGRMMGPRGMSPGQLLGFLAFDEEIALSDDQLLKLRVALKEAHKKHQEIMEEMMEGMQSGGMDFQEMRPKMMELTKETMERASSVLDEEQVERLKEHMQEMQSRRGPGGGGRPPRGGGGQEE